MPFILSDGSKGKDKRNCSCSVGPMTSAENVSASPTSPLSVIAHCESTHATMARRLRSDMDEFTCNVARCRTTTKEIKTPRRR